MRRREAEAEAVLVRLRARINWLYEEVLRQAQVGNLGTSRHFQNVAFQAELILADLRVYCSRNPWATKKQIVEILNHLKAE